MNVSGQLQDPTVVPSGKELRYPSNIRLGGLQSRSGCSSKVRNLVPAEELNHGSSVFAAYLIYYQIWYVRTKV